MTSSCYKNTSAIVICIGMIMGCRAQDIPTPKTLRIIWEDSSTDISGQVSRNGRWISYTDQSTGDLFVREISTGTKIKVTDRPHDVSEYAGTSFFSPEGDRIAFYWYGATREIRVASLNGDSNQVVISEDEIFGWSLDGESLLIHKEGQLGYIKIATKEFRSFLKVQETPLSASISPNGKFIVFTMFGADPTFLEIKIVSLENGVVFTFISGSGRPRSPVWTFDGKSIIYISDRESIPRVWRKSLDEKDSQESGQAIVDLPDALNVLMGTDSNGTIYIGAENRGGEDVYHGLVNWENNSVEKETKILSPAFRGTRRGVFSLSSSKIACLQRGRGYVIYPGWQTPLVRDLISGTEKTYPTQLTIRDEPAWAQNEKALYFIIRPRGKGGDLKWSFYQLNLNNGKYSLIGNAATAGPARMAGVTSNSIVYRNPTSIFSLDLSSGSSVLLYKHENNEIYDAALSPDGSRFALAMNNADGSKGLYILQKEKNILTPITSFQPNLQPQIMWFPSGDAIITSGRVNGKQGIWRIPVDGTQSQVLDFSAANVVDVRLSPDGRRIAFTKINRLPHQILALDNDF